MTLEEEIGQLLSKKGLTIAVAESCTGGMLGSAITSVNGSSDYFLGGVIAYSNQVKIGQVGVDADLLERVGAVHKLVACELAEGVRTRLGADIGLSITGIAGPDGGTDEKPVGFVCVGIAAKGECFAEEFHFGGDRLVVRKTSCRTALTILKEQLKRL